MTEEIILHSYFMLGIHDTLIPQPVFIPGSTDRALCLCRVPSQVITGTERIVSHAWHVLLSQEPDLLLPGPNDNEATAVYFFEP